MRAQVNLDLRNGFGFAFVHMFLRLTVAVVVGLGVAANCARSEAKFESPADGKFTEAQLVQFLDTHKDWLEANSKVLAAVTTAKTPADRAKAAGQIDQEYKACLDKHHLARQEYDWLSRSAQQAWGAAAYLDGSYKSARDQSDAEIKSVDASIAADKQQLAAYQEALKNGWRVLSPDDRDSVVKQAETEEQTARDEAKRRDDDVQNVEAEAKQHDADAEHAEQAASNPPSDLSSDERADYIQNKKDEAAAAKASAKEARTQETDSKTSEAEALGRADAAAKRAEHPEVPTTEDGKDQARQDDQGEIDRLNRRIEQLTVQRADLVKNQGTLEETAKKVVAGIPPENIEIMRKYSERYKEQVTDAVGGASTRKSG
jgi:hypothetical protein